MDEEEKTYVVAFRMEVSAGSYEEAAQYAQECFESEAGDTWVAEVQGPEGVRIINEKP